MIPRSIMHLAAAVGLIFFMGSAASAKEPSNSGTKPDATIQLSGGTVAAGIGYSWASGTLIYKGKHYPISVDGLSVGSVGAESATATGKVYHLKSVSDFDGTYASVGAGATVGGGAAVATMKNQNGVVVDLGSTARGLKFNLSASGVNMHVNPKAG